MIFFSYFLEKQVKQKYYKTINFFAKFESSCHDKKQKWILETTNQVGYETRVQTFNPFPWDDYFFSGRECAPKHLITIDEYYCSKPLLWYCKMISEKWVSKNLDSLLDIELRIGYLQMARA